jgi:catechol 2,3-dioxygenase-like lactoylglutathione lyase family enzyme
MSATPDRPSRGIDHVVIAVRDLDRAEAQFRRLGFALTPRGHHSKLGSYNHCAMFAEDYLELIAQGSQSRPALERFLRVREGVAGIALRTANARETFAKLGRLGLDAAEPVDFGRPVEREGRKQEARFTTTELDSAATAGIRVFFCEHQTPELVWLPEFLVQPNGVTGLAGIVAVDEGALFAGLFARILGEESPSIEYLSPAAAALRFGGDPILAVTQPYVAALRLSVRDRAATARFLATSGVPIRHGPDGAFQVSSRDAMGAVLEFV